MVTSMLFVPASDQRKLDKATRLGPQPLILDLEDAVAISMKPAARQNAADMIATRGAEVPIFVRVNNVDSGFFFSDLEAIIRPGLSGVYVPKVRTSREVLIADWLVSSLEQRAAVPPSTIDLAACIETVSGVAHLREICHASSRLKWLSFGEGDFCLDVGLEWPPASGQLPETVIYAKVLVVQESRLAGLEPPHDGAYARFEDQEGLRKVAVQSKTLGFFGKHAIHPDQLSTIDDVFTPTAVELEQARRIVDSFSAEEAGGRANIAIDGHFVDYPVYFQAQRLLALASSGGADVV